MKMEIKENKRNYINKWETGKGKLWKSDGRRAKRWNIFICSLIMYSKHDSDWNVFPTQTNTKHALTWKSFLIQLPIQTDGKKDNNRK